MAYRVGRFAILTLRDFEPSAELVPGSCLHRRCYCLAGFDRHSLHYRFRLDHLERGP